MRSWKIAFAATAVAVVVAAAVALWRGGALVGGTAGAATPNPATIAMPVPVTPSSEGDPDLPGLFGAHGVDPQHRPASQGLRLYPAAARPDGTDVKEGDLLYTIDPRDFQAALDQRRRRCNAMRRRSTMRTPISSAGPRWPNPAPRKDTFDQRASTAGQAEATLAMDQAAVRAAELNLGYTEIRAPFGGRLGRNQAPVGALIGVAGASLNTLVQLDPIYVTFNPSETDLVEIQRARAAGRIAADILLPGETQARYKGELTFIDNAVDRSTGTIVARATIATPISACFRPIRSCSAGHQDGARCPDGAADRVGIESVGQIRLRRRRRKQGGPASRFAGPQRRRPRSGAKRASLKASTSSTAIFKRSVPERW